MKASQRSPKPTKSYQIRGLTVEFPYEAYPCQLVYMEKVIETLQKERQFALLESPTGTGKTLCLLCASLAWLMEEKAQRDRQRGPMIRKNSGGDLSMHSDSHSSSHSSSQTYSSLPRLIYASRTHSQLNQVIKELKNTSYRPKTTILGSRQQMCVHPQVRNLETHAQNVACRKLVASNPHRCGFYDRVRPFMASPDALRSVPAVVDIEDLVHMDGGHVCPYYLARELQPSAEIIFMPYNYIIDPAIRLNLNLELNSSIIIFDEAHNLESVCCDTASFELTTRQLGEMVKEIDCFMLNYRIAPSSWIEEQDDKDQPADKLDMSKVRALKSAVIVLREHITDLRLGDDGVTFGGTFIFDLLAQNKINKDNKDEYLDLIQLMLTSEAITTGTTYLSILNNCLSVLFKDDVSIETMRKAYKVHVQKVTSQRGRHNQIQVTVEERMISFWCFDASLEMNAIKSAARSLIFTSGTLTPLACYAKELNINFALTLENPHIISRWQCWVGVLKCGPRGEPLKSTYDNRHNLAYLEDLGQSIVEICTIVPHGVLVFFPSYTAMNRCLNYWQAPKPGTTYSVWDSMCAQKEPVVEPSGGDKLFKLAMEDFYGKIRNSKTTGAIFFAVCRGKVSEGIDFADRHGRAVILAGLPYPSKADAKVMLKESYLDEAIMRERTEARLAKPKLVSHPNGANAHGAGVAHPSSIVKSLSGKEWYNLSCSRASNQAVGRVIRFAFLHSIFSDPRFLTLRHNRDYGAIILADERFAWKREELSAWLRPSFTVYNDLDHGLDSLRNFFRVAHENFPEGDDAPMPNAPQNGYKTGLDESGLRKPNSSDGHIKFSFPAAQQAYQPSLQSQISPVLVQSPFIRNLSSNIHNILNENRNNSHARPSANNSNNNYNNNYNSNNANSNASNGTTNVPLKGMYSNNNFNRLPQHPNASNFDPNSTNNNANTTTNQPLKRSFPPSLTTAANDSKPKSYGPFNNVQVRQGRADIALPQPTLQRGHQMIAQQQQQQQQFGNQQMNRLQQQKQQMAIKEIKNRGFTNPAGFNRENVQQQQASILPQQRQHFGPVPSASDRKQPAMPQTKPPSTALSAPPKPVVSTNNANGLAPKKHDTHDYLNRCKKILPRDNFEKFRLILQVYRENRNVDELLTTVVSLLGNKLETQQLLSDFLPYIPPGTQQERFARVVKSNNEALQQIQNNKRKLDEENSMKSKLLITSTNSGSPQVSHKKSRLGEAMLARPSATVTETLDMNLSNCNARMELGNSMETEPSSSQPRLESQIINIDEDDNEEEDDYVISFT